VNPDVVDVYARLKKQNTPKRKQNNLLKTKRILNTNLSAKGAQFLHLACQGGSPHYPISYVTE